MGRLSDEMHLHRDQQEGSAKGRGKTSFRLEEVAQASLLPTGRAAPTSLGGPVLCGTKQAVDAESHEATRCQGWGVSRRMSSLCTLCHHPPQGSINTMLAVSMTSSLREVA